MLDGNIMLIQECPTLRNRSANVSTATCTIHCV